MSKLELIAQVSYAAKCVTLQESYNRAYVGVWPNPRVVILDIAQPAQPRIIGETALISNIPLDIAIEGDYVYVVEENGLHIVDSSNSHRPKEVSVCPISLKPLGVAVSGKYAYIANWTLARIQPSDFEKQKIMRSFDRSSHGLDARNPEQQLPYSTVASQGNGRALATPLKLNLGWDGQSVSARA